MGNSTTKRSFLTLIRMLALFLSAAVIISALSFNVSAASPKLSSSALTVAVGETRTLTLKNSEGTVKWSTSDKKIATVSKGKVTGIKSGKVTITAKYKSKTYECTVTVKPYRIYAKTTKMEIGDTQTLKLKGNTDGKTIKWTSSDKNVASVSSKGKVTAKSAGTAKISAKIGTNKYSKTITVNPVMDDSGKVFNIYTWNSEFPDILEKYYPAYEKTSDYSGYIGDVRVNFFIEMNVADIYEKKLQEALLDRYASADEKVDLFLVEDMNAEIYMASPYVKSMADIGITDADTKNMYQVTKDIGSYDGKLMAASWQVCPGGFAYRRSIAKEVLGTDDPEKVQKYLSSWSKFESTASKMKDKGYYMVSDTYAMRYSFFFNEDNRFVDGNTIKMNDNMRDWLAISKRFYDKGYCSGSSTWSADWTYEQAYYGSKVFGFFYSTWGINYSLSGYSLEYGDDGTYGDWAFVEGPESYIWGGNYICVGGECDNMSIAADIIRTLCCDYDNMLKMAKGGDGIYPNNSKVLNKMAKMNIKDDLLDGQNSYAVFAKIAKKCKAPGGVGLYDSYMFYEKYDLFNDYFNGTMSYEEVMEQYYKTLQSEYPELSTPKKMPKEPK